MQEIEGQPTGTCICLINQVNRSCYANIGASTHYRNVFASDQEIISPILELKLKTNKQYLYIEGFFVTGPRFSVCKFLIDEVCKPSDGLRIFTANLSASYIVQNNPEQMRYFAERSTILFGNRNEFTKLAELYNMATAEDIIAHLVDPTTNGNTEKIVICTQGAGNVLYSSRFHKFVNRSFVVRPVPMDSIVDTTGCGDAFVAGFFLALINDSTITDCVAKGVEVAQRKLTSVGGTFEPLAMNK